MILRSKLIAAGAATALAASLFPLSGCTSDSGPTITHVDRASEDDTSTLTPLERGEARRNVLESLQAGIDAWDANDLDTMGVHFSDNITKLFADQWTEYEARGLTVKHVKETVYFDVIEFNKAGTQALVTYRYNDDSYLVDSNGDRVEGLEPLSENELQFTVEKQDDGSWLAVRLIGAELR